MTDVLIAGGQSIAVLATDEVPVILVMAGEQGPPGPPGRDAPGSGVAPAISDDPDNRLTQGSDNGLFVLDDLIPDPLAYYILAKG